MNWLDLPEQSTTLSSSPAWKAFWTADKYLTCRPFHGKYSLQSNYFGFPNVYFRFLQLEWRAVSAGLFRRWRKRRYPWGGLRLCPRRGSSVEQAAFGSCDTNVTPEAWTQTSAQIHGSGSWLCIVSDFSCTMELPGLWQRPSWGALHSLHFTHSTSISFIKAKKSFFQSARSRELRIQLGSIYNISELSTNCQFTPTKIRRASARFDWSQGQSCFIFWLVCSHQSSPGWIASSQAVLFLLNCSYFHLYFCIHNNKGQNW